MTAKQIFIMVVLGLPFVILSREKERKPESIFLSALFLCGIASSLPRFSYFHLQPMLAVYSIFIALLVIPKRRYFILLLPSLVFIYILKQSPGLFGLSPRFYDKETQEISRIVSRETGKGEKMYLLGPNSMIYVLADRIPPKPWIENYVWHFEVPGLQEKVIAGWETNPPKIIFWTPPTPGNWFDLGTYQPKIIFEWISKNYVHKENTRSGVEVWYKKGDV